MRYVEKLKTKWLCRDWETHKRNDDLTYRTRGREHDKTKQRSAVVRPRAKALLRVVRDDEKHIENYTYFSFRCKDKSHGFYLIAVNVNKFL